MSNILKTDNNTIEEYLNAINKKCETVMKMNKTIKTATNEQNSLVPTFKCYNRIINLKYNVTQLKMFAKHYKLKLSGNKNELTSRLFNFLYLSFHIIKIQKTFRMFLVKRYKQLHGPAAFNRNLCTNESDLISMEPIEEINFHQFISYKDIDGFIYGFDINSLHNLFIKSEEIAIKNPYNRNPIPELVFKNIRSLIRFGKILNINIELNFENDTKNLTNEKTIELRALALFQNIDALGNYSNCNWFLSLNRLQLAKFSRELIDIWNYRAQIPAETKKNICPPHGQPFRNFAISYVMHEENLWNVKTAIIEIMEKFVNSGRNKDSKTLGAYYVLGALTLVSSEAATTMPWLFQSVNYF